MKNDLKYYILTSLNPISRDSYLVLKSIFKNYILINIFQVKID